MDRGPFRGSRSTDRGVPSRAERPDSVSQTQQPHQSASIEMVDEPQDQRHAPRPRNEKKAKKTSAMRSKTFIIAGITLLLIVAGWFIWQQTRSVGATIDSSKYQAVFFTNGNVYFGKLRSLNSEYMILDTIYYPQSQANGENTDTQGQADLNQSNVTLIKLGDAIHGPENEMTIPKDQIQFFQNLRSDSRVAELIDGQKE